MTTQRRADDSNRVLSAKKEKKSLYLQKEKETKLYYLCPMLYPTRQTFVRRLFVFQTGISVACEPQKYFRSSPGS